jgi:DNA-binding HxlR family transcriptional regulator
MVLSGDAATSFEPPPAMPALVDLCHHRWAIPVIASLFRERGGRFAAMARGLGVSRESLRQTLGALAERDLALRNPGYGHPMRPEYLLSPEGERIGRACLGLVEEAAGRGVERVVRRKWSAPALAAMGLGAERFSEVRSALGGVTPRALTQALQSLETSGLLRRRVSGGRPAQVTYGLTQRGEPLAAACGALLEALGE